MFTPNTETVTTSAEKTTFVCDRCSHLSTSKRQALEHYGEKHVVRAETKIGEFELHFLETEDDFDAWIAHESRDVQFRYAEWCGAGWYSLSRWSTPCSRSCCTDKCLGTDFLAKLISSEQEELREKARTLRDLNKLLKGTP